MAWILPHLLLYTPGWNLSPKRWVWIRSRLDPKVERMPLPMKDPKFPARHLICLALALAALAQPAPVRAQEEAWPLDRTTRYLTSNFMEYRGGRFHAGIDLKTNSENGYVVRAVEDGYVQRVRTTPFAYGRAIYVRGVSGRTFVYAHLMRFNDELRFRVRQAQTESGSYRVGVSFRPGEIPVKKGQALALSGESGTDGPHLHFEVRDTRGRPVDPQAQGFAVPDTFPPVIHDLTAWPALPEVTLNGSGEPHRLRGGDPGLRGDLPVLVASGAVAFSARITEYTDIRGHKLEPWLIEVKLDGAVVYSCRNEAFDFAQNSLQRLEWADQADRENESFREHWLHRRPGNELTGREGGLWYLGPRGQGLDKGSHLLEIAAEDRAGNRTAARLVLVVGSNPAPGAAEWSPEQLGISDGRGFRLTPFFSSGIPAESGARLLRFDPQSGDPVLAPVELLVQPWPGETTPVQREQGLARVGPGAHFLAVDWPVDADLRAAFPAGAGFTAEHLADDPRIGVYRRHRKGMWKLVGPVLPGAGGQVEFALAEPGLHAVLRDDQPPLITAAAPPEIFPGPSSKVEGISLPRWSPVPVLVVDEGAGIAPETIVVQLEGRPLIAEPDLPRDRILVELPDDLAAGEHHLYVEAADEAGNTAGLDLKILCREEKP
jgi:murein DD-endopeptidase MepM/ murein hydrolase activator NlpD